MTDREHRGSHLLSRQMVLRHLGLQHSLLGSEICFFAFCGQLCHANCNLRLEQAQLSHHKRSAAKSSAFFFFTAIRLQIQALGLPPAPMPNGAKFSPPGWIQSFLPF